MNILQALFRWARKEKKRNLRDTGQTIFGMPVFEDESMEPDDVEFGYYKSVTRNADGEIIFEVGHANGHAVERPENTRRR